MGMLGGQIIGQRQVERESRDTRIVSGGLPPVSTGLVMDEEAGSYGYSGFALTDVPEAHNATFAFAQSQRPPGHQDIGLPDRVGGHPRQTVLFCKPGGEIVAVPHQRLPDPSVTIPLISRQAVQTGAERQQDRHIAGAVKAAERRSRRPQASDGPIRVFRASRLESPTAEDLEKGLYPQFLEGYPHLFRDPRHNSNGRFFVVDRERKVHIVGNVRVFLEKYESLTDIIGAKEIVRMVYEQAHLETNGMKDRLAIYRKTRNEVLKGIVMSNQSDPLLAVPQMVAVQHLFDRLILAEVRQQIEVIMPEYFSGVMLEQDRSLVGKRFVEQMEESYPDREILARKIRQIVGPLAVEDIGPQLGHCLVAARACRTFLQPAEINRLLLYPESPVYNRYLAVFQRIINTLSYLDVVVATGYPGQKVVFEDKTVKFTTSPGILPLSGVAFS